MSSIKRNFGYNLALSFCGYIFPLITYPYVSRVLGVENIGICNFVDSLLNYFILFSVMGVSSYGVREIARYADDKKTLQVIFSNLVCINGVGTIITAILLVVCTYTLQSLIPYKQYLLMGLIKLLFNMFLVEWLFQGLQEFKYITIRSICVRLFYLASVFIFVKSQDDSVVYYSLTIAVAVLNSIINWKFSKRFTKFLIVKIEWKSFLIPVLTFGYYRILTSMYTTFNTVFLGFSSGNTEVGYFSTATKLYTILMAVFSAFTTVMVPKVSEMLKNGELLKLEQISKDTFEILTLISLPIIIYCQFCSEDIIHFISGPGYEGAVLPFRIVIFLLLIIGMEQIIIQQFLMATHSYKSIFVVSTIGAIVGILLNIILTPNIGAIGSSLAWGGAEVSVLITGIILVKRILGIKIPYKTISKMMLLSLFYLIAPYLLSHFNIHGFAYMIASALLFFIIFTVVNIYIYPSSIIKSLLFKKKNLNI